MKFFSFILILFASTVMTTSCQPAKQGGYEAPGRGNEGELQEDLILKPDSSIEKAVMEKDSVRKRKYHL